MSLNTADFLTLTQYILNSPTKTLVAEWSGLNERDKLAVAERLEEIRQFGQRTLYRAITDLAVGQNLSPIKATMVAWSIKDLNNIKDVREKLRSEQLQLREGAKFSEIKPLIVNSFNVLIKVYCLVTYEDAALYLQTKKVILPVKHRITREHVAALELVHADLVSLLSWERVARMLMTARYGTEDLTALTEVIDNYYPPIDVFVSVVERTLEVISEMRIFGQALMKTLREEDNITDFFLNVDALHLAVKSVADGHTDDEYLRQKLAFTRMMHDFISDSAMWSMLVTGLTETTRV